MSTYYKYNFISPESIYAQVQEELKSYFDTGAVDSLMFPTYVDKCLKKLGKSSYTITQEVLFIEDFEARLPDNFHAVREAWMCTSISARSYQSASSFYSQTFGTTIQVVPSVIAGEDYVVDPDALECADCDNTAAVYKTNYEFPRVYQKMYLLKPGNISARRNCDVEYTSLWNDASGYPVNYNTPGASSFDSFDIRDNKFVTNFRTATVYLVFYATDYDDLGNQLIPDNYRITEYIYKFLKYKMFETLTNQTNDETFNQLQQKMIFYKQEADEAYILAESEIKKQDVYAKQRAIKRNLNRFNMYELPNKSERFGWRRNYRN
ncbi:MAG: hypothetical protein H5T96_09090 [Tissierellales bacterium]|nr:hypothetical protein [Tissierellales bacterium]